MKFFQFALMFLVIFSSMYDYFLMYCFYFDLWTWRQITILPKAITPINITPNAITLCD